MTSKETAMQRFRMPARAIAMSAAIIISFTTSAEEAAEAPKLDEKYMKCFSGIMTDVECASYAESITKLVQGAPAGEVKALVAALNKVIDAGAKRGNDDVSAKDITFNAVNTKVCVYVNIAKDTESPAVRKAAEGEAAAARKKGASLDADRQISIAENERKIYLARLKPVLGMDEGSLAQAFTEGVPVWGDVDQRRGKEVVMEASLKNFAANNAALSAFDDVLHSKSAGAAKKAMVLLDQKMSAATRTLLPSIGGEKPPKDFAEKIHAAQAMYYAMAMKKAADGCQAEDVKAVLQGKAKELKSKAAAHAKRQKDAGDKAKFESMLQEL